jgi:hypothetical protein
MSKGAFYKHLAEEATIDNKDTEKIMVFNTIAIQREMKWGWEQTLQCPAAVGQAIEKQIENENKMQKKEQEKAKFKNKK